MQQFFQRGIVCLGLALGAGFAHAEDKGAWLGEYTSSSVGGGFVSRDGAVAAAAEYSFSRRDEIGWFTAANQTRLGLATDLGFDTIGGYGELGWTLGVTIGRDWAFAPTFGLGPSLELSALPGADVHLGLNVMATAGLDMRKGGMAQGLSTHVDLRMPTTWSTASGDLPFITAGIGYISPSKATRARASRSARRTITPAATAAAAPSEGTAKTVVTAPGEGAAIPVSMPPPPRAARLDTARCEVDLSTPILFGDASAQPLPESDPVLRDVAAVLTEHPEITRVQLEGHTDERGASAYNKKLSTWRVEAVTDLLVQLDVAPGRLEGVGYGEDRPVVPSASTEADHAKNRRVVFRVVEGPGCGARSGAATGG